jgi:hypothetical protein
VYFLEIGENANDSDPSDKFIKRFADHLPPVRKVSACVVVMYGHKVVLEKKTGQKSRIYHVTSIKWNSGTEVEVEGWPYEGGLMSSRNTYTLTKDKGRWRVTNERMNAI